MHNKNLTMLIKCVSHSWKIVIDRGKFLYFFSSAKTAKKRQFCYSQVTALRVRSNCAKNIANDRKQAEKKQEATEHGLCQCHTFI